jgi:sugar phosphate isomerase/epimerase
VPRQPAAPVRATAQAYDDAFRKSVRLAEQLDVPVVVTFSGCPGDSDDASTRTG